MKYLGRIIREIVFLDSSIRQDNSGCGMSGPPKITYNYTIEGLKKEFDSESEAKAYIRKLRRKSSKSSSDLGQKQKTQTCKHRTRKPLILKMGGLLCPTCRTVLHEAHSPQWLKRAKNNKVLKEFEIEEREFEIEE